MRTTLITSLVALAAMACTTMPAPKPVSASLTPAGAVRHVVVFKFKPDASPAKIRQITEAFAALKDQIPNVLAFEHGVNNSPENLNQGFTHVYQLTFTNAAARDVYLVHPAHKAFGTLLGSTTYGRVRVGEAVRGSLVLETAYGEVEAGIAAGTAAWLDLQSGSGSIRSELTAAEGPDDATETVEVQARTAYGDILVRRA